MALADARVLATVHAVAVGSGAIVRHECVARASGHLRGGVFQHWCFVLVSVLKLVRHLRDPCAWEMEGQFDMFMCDRLGMRLAWCVCESCDVVLVHVVAGIGSQLP